MGKTLTKQFGRWTVIGEPVKVQRGKRRYVLCRCLCGQEKKVRIEHLLTGASRSCGCLIGDTARTHGASETPTYRTWERIISRCENPQNRAFKNYGARGIKVCPEWRNSFEKFRADMGLKPAGMTIERINNAKDYEPGNCKWATQLEQNRNTRKNKYLTYAGETLCQAEWAARFGMLPKTLEGRLKRGWSVDKALTTPINPKMWANR